MHATDDVGEFDGSQEPHCVEPGPGLHGDRPDGDPETDRLGYAPTAYAIAATIRANCDRTESFVYGVHGPWGSGKSTVLRYVEQALSEEIGRKELFVVHFNPWWFSGEETLFAVFFDELLATIGEPLGDKVKVVLKRFASGVSGLTGLLKFGMGLVPGLNLLPEEARSALVDAFGAAGDDTNLSLDDTRQVLERELEKAPFRTLVIIDDIDRLTGDEQLAMFRLVKSVADLPKVDYLLAFDDRLAERILRTRPEYAADGAYLEKIVQGVFHLPVLPRYVLSDWFVNSLHEILPAEENKVSDEEHWQCVLRYVVNPTLTTPRAVIRLGDAVRAYWPIVRGEVDLADFIALQAIRLFRKSTFNAIRENYLWLTHEDPYGELTIDDSDDTEQKRAKKLLEVCGPDEPDGKGSEEILATLFPRFTKHARDSFRFAAEGRADNKTLRICNSARFPVYFGQALGEMTLSRRELLRALVEPFDRECLDTLINACVSTTRRGGGSLGPIFVDELSIVLEEQDTCIRRGLIEVLFERGDELITHADLQHAGFSVWPELALTRLLGSLLVPMNMELRVSTLEAAIELCGAPTTLTYLFADIIRRKDPRSDDDDSAAKLGGILDSDEFEKLAESLHKRLLQKLFDESMVELHNSKGLIVEWRNFAPDNRLDDCLCQLATSAAGRAQLAALMVGHGGNSSSGPFDTVPKWSERPVDIKSLADKIRIDLEQTPQSEKVPVLQRFLEAFKHTQRLW